MEYRIQPIGVIKTPYKKLEGMPIQPTGAKDVKGIVLVNEEFEDGLKDVEGFSHLILLYLFHKSKGYSLEVKPFLDDNIKGLFSTRAPRRPNPIGLSVVKLIKRNHNILDIQGIDVIDGTPLIDIKPYVPGFDAKAPVKTGWLEKNQEKANSVRSDRRFIQC